MLINIDAIFTSVQKCKQYFLWRIVFKSCSKLLEVCVMHKACAAGTVVCLFPLCIKITILRIKLRCFYIETNPVNTAIFLFLSLDHLYSGTAYFCFQKGSNFLWRQWNVDTRTFLSRRFKWGSLKAYISALHLERVKLRTK